MVKEVEVSGINFNSYGLQAVMTPYMADVLIYLWKTGAEMSSAEVMVWHRGYVKNTEEGESMSRASYIVGLNALAENGVLSYTDKTGKGGYRRIYRAAKTPDLFMIWLEQSCAGAIESVRGELENEQLL